MKKKKKTKNKICQNKEFILKAVQLFSMKICMNLPCLFKERNTDYKYDIGTSIFVVFFFLKWLTKWLMVNSVEWANAQKSIICSIRGK